MKVSKLKLVPLAAAIGVALAANAAMGATLDTRSAANVLISGNPGEVGVGGGGDGILQNFSSIDWHQNGAGLIQGFGLTGANNAGDFDDFTFTYQAFAAAIGTTSTTPDLRVGAPGPGVGTYELTTVSTLNQRATCLNAGCSSISLSLLPGSVWTIWFDTSPDAVQATGSGFVDGAPILSGTWNSELSTFLATGSAGSPGAFGVGSATLFGTVLITDNAFVNPDLAGTRFDSTLNFPGQNPPDFTRPTFINGIATGPNTDSQFVLQVDGSQPFTPAVVPEPATLGLLGVGLFGMAAFLRRREKQV